MEIQSQVNLAPYTTFKIGGPAKFFCEARTNEDLLEAFAFAHKQSLPVFVLGGGSNSLISDAGWSGLAIHVVNQGITFRPVEKKVQLEATAGQSWDSVVAFANQHGWWGIENLSHIPGSSGASVVQNIGAYGQEISQTLARVETFDTQTNKLAFLDNPACGFDYRKSIFNSEQRGRYVILRVFLELGIEPAPNLNYPDLKNRFSSKEPSLPEIRSAVIEIRNKKYPYPTKAKNGNAGSFFKNVFLTPAKYAELKKVTGQNLGAAAAEKLEAMKNKFPQEQQIKVPTAFLLDLCGIKGASFGGARINPAQPLIVLNGTGQATAGDVLNLAKLVRDKIKKKTGLSLEIEPELVGFSPEELAAMV